MWKPDLVWWEFLVRAVVVYVFLLLLLRLSGKRQVGQLAPFDLVLLLFGKTDTSSCDNAIKLPPATRLSPSSHGKPVVPLSIVREISERNGASHRSRIGRNTGG